MSRNRSHEPPKPQEDLIPASTYNTLIQNFQSKLSALEKKYLSFVNHCTKIIREAQSFIDQSIQDHMSNSVNASSKLIETLTQQKVKLQDELMSIEKMSIDLDYKHKDKQEITNKLCRVVQRTRQHIISKIEDQKSKQHIQDLLLRMEEKLSRGINLVLSMPDYKDRVIELENLILKKDKDYEILQEYTANVKNEYEMTRTVGVSEFKGDRKIMSPTFRGSLGGRTSPGFGSSINKVTQQKDQEIARLKCDIQVLQDKIFSLTEKAQKIVQKKENEVQKLNNERWPLEKIIEDLKVDMGKKDEAIKSYKETMGKINKAYTESNDKMQRYKAEVEDLTDKINEKTQKNNELSQKLSESQQKIVRHEEEIIMLKSCKEEFDSEITELKDYFQSDIDSLSNKIEKMFGENLALKQRNEEIKEKYEKVMTEKEKLLIQLLEIKDKEGSYESTHSSKTEGIKIQAPSSLALKQELKVTNVRMEGLQKEVGEYKMLIKGPISSFFNVFSKKLNELSNFVDIGLGKSQSKVLKLVSQVKKIHNCKKNLQKTNTRKTEENLDDSLNFQIQELKRSEGKLTMQNEKLIKKCCYYEGLLEKFDKNCEILTQQLESKDHCKNCEIMHKNITEKEQIISSLQQVISNLEKENLKLDKEIQDYEFTFQNSIFDSKFPSKDEGRSQKSKRFQLSSNDQIKTFDSKLLEISNSKVDLTYTLEDTSIKSAHNPPTPLRSSDEEFQDLEYI